MAPAKRHHRQADAEEMAESVSDREKRVPHHLRGHAARRGNIPHLGKRHTRWNGGTKKHLILYTLLQSLMISHPRPGQEYGCSRKGRVGRLSQVELNRQGNSRFGKGFNQLPFSFPLAGAIAPSGTKKKGKNNKKTLTRTR